MKHWWSGLAVRERWFLTLGVVILLAGMAYTLAWRPISRDIALSRERVDLLRSDLSWMRAASAKIHALHKVGASRSKPGGSLAGLIDRSTRRLGIEQAITQLTSEGDNAVSVSLADVAFAKLLRWVEQLAEQGVGVKRLDLTPAASPGRVQATLVFVRGSGE